jgi:magnesium chelatase family protein
VIDDQPFSQFQMVEAARRVQHKCLVHLNIHSNSQMEARHIREFCPIDAEGISCWRW